MQDTAKEEKFCLLLFFQVFSGTCFYYLSYVGINYMHAIVKTVEKIKFI